MEARVRGDRSRIYFEHFRLWRFVESLAFLLAGIERPFERRVPAVPRYEGARFASIDAALEDKPKFFEHLMAATGSCDRREIVRELNAIRARRALDRDPEGRYFINAAS